MGTLVEKVRGVLEKQAAAIERARLSILEEHRHELFHTAEAVDRVLERYKAWKGSGER
jgi:alpha-beta hydrolase superfamily lysophospholipase